MIKDLTFYVMSKDEKIAKCVIKDGKLVSIDKYAKKIYEQPFYGENISLEYVISFLKSRTVNINKDDIDEDKKNEIIEELLTYFDEHSCWRGEAIHQNDDAISEAPTVLAEILDYIIKPEIVEN